MRLISVGLRINAFLTKLKYKCYFGKGFKYGKFTCRKRFNVFVEKTGTITIGDGCFFNNDCSLNCHEKITIGNDCVFGENVKIYDHNHKFRDENTRIANQGFSIAPIHIGDNCWIGSNVTILKGARIGKHVVIGAGCIVDREIKDNSIVTSTSRELIITKMEK